MIRSAYVLLALSLTVLGTWTPALAGQDAGPFDLLVRGGRVLDGTGNPWVRADVGVRDGRIVAVGLLPEARADRGREETTGSP